TAWPPPSRLRPIPRGRVASSSTIRMRTQLNIRPGEKDPENKKKGPAGRSAVPEKKGPARGGPKIHGRVEGPRPHCCRWMLRHQACAAPSVSLRPACATQHSRPRPRRRRLPPLQPPPPPPP